MSVGVGVCEPAEPLQTPACTTLLGDKWAQRRDVQGPISIELLQPEVRAAWAAWLGRGRERETDRQGGRQGGREGGRERKCVSVGVCANCQLPLLGSDSILAQFMPPAVLWSSLDIPLLQTAIGSWVRIVHSASALWLGSLAVP